MPFLSALALLLIALKLTGFIAWSWTWVLAPIWASILITAIVIVGAFALSLWVDRK